MTAPAGTDATDRPGLDPRLAAWEKRANPVVIAAALIPIGVAFVPKAQDNPFVLIDLASWLVFLVDLVVHLRYRRHYLRTMLGRFDLIIVVLTFPWFLIPGLGGTKVLGLARLGRLGRVLLAGGSTGVLRRLAARLGHAGLYSLVLIAVCSFVVYKVEPPSSGFATYGNALWWGFVTFTTVGYGDLVPVTPTGRVVAVLLMIGGIGLIGLLAGSLADFFRSPARPASEGSASPEPSGAGAGSEPSGGPDVGPDVGPELLAEVRALRLELAEVRSALGNGASPTAE